MIDYKLFNTDGKTFFDFRSNPESRCEGFTLTFCDDGTVVMSGDYGTLCWKRNFHYAGDKEFRRDYGFPNKETGISYFAEKVSQWGIEQKIEGWYKDKAIEMFKERYSGEDFEDKFSDVLEEIESLEEYDEIKFFEILRDSGIDDDYWEYKWVVYTPHFRLMFEILQSVSDQIIEVVYPKGRAIPSQESVKG